MPRESDLTTAILRALNALPDTVAIKLHGGPYSTAGMPDILCVRKARYLDGTFWKETFGEYGQAYFLEVKLPGKKPTAIQEARMMKLREAGAVCAVVHSVREALDAAG